MKILPGLLLTCILFQKNPAQNTFLQKPVDLQQFKKAKGPSNSGIADIQQYYFKPAEKGVYFRFFIFRSPNTFIYSGTENKKQHVPYGTGFQIVTYKPPGKYRDAYLDPTEMLIEVTASYNDPDLPELAFVGLDTVTIKKKLGNHFIRKDNYFIYSADNNVLILNITEGVVKCLKYTRLNAKIANTNMESLTDMNCRNQPVR
jgi:hypothetical protein